MARMSVMTHDTVCRLVNERVPKGGRVLEVSCGSGWNLDTLRKDGYEVRGTNFSVHDMHADDLPIDLGVDVTKALPYDDASFDALLLCDVIEHIYDHPAALKEIARVLKVGGWLIMPTPNVMRINSRLHYLLTGFLKIKRSFIGFDVPLDQAFAFHNNPPQLPQTIYYMHAVGLRCELEAIEYKPKSILWWLLLAPLIYPCTWYKLHKGEKFLKGTDAAETIFRLQTSFKALCGEALVIMGQKFDMTPSGEMKTKLPEWHAKIETE
ncbi:MAG: methyltransferase domain-containing protein [Planctomycetes bacterium]|nr:methyltransferase domain-containing protein [Planctomycetota bacterium]